MTYITQTDQILTLLNSEPTKWFSVHEICDVVTDNGGSESSIRVHLNSLEGSEIDKRIFKIAGKRRRVYYRAKQESEATIDEMFAYDDNEVMELNGEFGFN